MRLWQWFKTNTFSPDVSKEQAISIAQDECQKLKYPWLEPVIVRSNWGVWEVYTNARSKGGNARIIINKNTGRVVKAIILPR
jgi:hypothetical protein